MRSKISFSRFSTVLTCTVLLALFVGCIVSVHDKPIFFTLLPLYVIAIICALLYAPLYIMADADKLYMGSVLRKRALNMHDIAGVELFSPTMGAMRIFASGGFMGYWGMFREGDVGRYYGFYGKASDCFMVRMKNGDKYVLGCDNPEAMVVYIKSRL